MLRVGSSGKIRACGKGPDNTVRNNYQTQKGASLLTSNFPNFCHHHYRHQHVLVNHQLPGSLFELPPKLSMSFWPEAAFHFALKGRGREGGRGPQKSSHPPCAALSFADGIAGREQVRLPLRFHPTLLLLLLSPNRQRKLFQERKRRRNFCPRICKYFSSRAVKDKAFCLSCSCSVWQTE